MTPIRVISVIALLSYVFLLVLIRGQARRREVRSFALFLIGMLVWQIGATGATFAATGETAIWCYRILMGPGAMFAVFYAQFVRDFLRIHSHKWFMRLGYLWLFVATIYIMGGGPYILVGIDSVPGTGFLVPVLGGGALIHAAIVYVYLGYAAYNLVRHYRRVSDPFARARIRYLVFGLTLVAVGSMSNLSEPLRGIPLDMVANVINAALIAITIMRHDLFEIGRAVRKGLAYVIPTAVITAIYIGTLVLLVNSLHLVFGYQTFFTMLVVTVGLALMIEPLRWRTQAWLDRLFFREKYDMTQMLRRLSRPVASVLNVRELASLILNEVFDTLHVERALLLLRKMEGDDFDTFASVGADDEPICLVADNPICTWLTKNSDCLTSYNVAVEPHFRSLWIEERSSLEAAQIEVFVPLMVGEQLVGILALGAKRSLTPYSPEEQLTLLTLANQVAVAVQNAWLYQAAIEEKEQTETVLQSAFSGIMVIAPDMRILAMNKSTQTITGFMAEDLIGKPLNTFFGIELWGKESALARAVRSGQTQPPQEIRIAGKEGLRDILLGVTPVRDGYLLNFADITQLKDVDRLKSNIVSNVSHELRTPLASIKAYTELLLGGFAAEDEHLRSDFLSVIDSEADRLAEFIDDLLDLSRLQAGNIGWQTGLLDFGALLHGIVDSLAVQAVKAGVMIRTDFAKKMPLIMGNGEILKSMVRNLISNAIKYSAKGDVVSIRTRVIDDCVALDVIDEGIGIPSDDLPYLFTRFYRSWTAREAGVRGTGLGLALVKEAVDLHHGAISVESEINVGTRFTVTLPIPNKMQPMSTKIESTGAQIMINEMV